VINSCTMAVPMKPVAPVINTRIIDLFVVTNMQCFDCWDLSKSAFGLAKTIEG